MNGDSALLTVLLAMLGGAIRVSTPFLFVSLGEIKRQTLQRYGEIDAFELHFDRHLQGARREVQNGLDPCVNDLVDDRLRVVRGYGDDRNVESLATREPFQVAYVVNGYTATRFMSDFLVRDIEQRSNLEPLLAEAGVVGEREPEVSGTHDAHSQASVESQNLTQMTAEFLDVIADAPNSELAEICQVLANLRRIQVELFCKGLR